MSFLTGAFLVGLVAAAGPFLIHLLNRRRHRTVEWAAMEFLREAIRRNKRLVELRDLLLMALRTLAVILFVLAMARPYWVSDKTGGYTGQPVHAVLVVDNSLSMGFTQLDKSLLDVARDKAGEFIQKLPKGSDVSIIPLCDLDEWHVQSVYSTREDALEALDRIEIVDRAARASLGAELAFRACQEASEIPTKRVVFLGDMQDNTWSIPDVARYFERLDDVQTVQVSPPLRENTSVSDFRLRDGVADADTPAVFTATISHSGAEPRKRVRVTLKIGDGVSEERFVDLLPGQDLQLVFNHKFDIAGSANQPLFVPARLEITPDRLEADDFRTCVVPVVAQVPVLCVDQYGETEKPDSNRYGETYPLRRLLAPAEGDSQSDKRLVDIRHRIASQVTREDLKDARLALFAGVSAPTPQLVQELREYVQQGGQLLIAAGGEFSAQAWNDVAWQDGAGILPAPLRALPVGQLPSELSPEVPKFHLAANSFKDEAFQMNLTDREQQELLLTPFFYRAVGIDEGALAKLDEAEGTRLKERHQALEDYEANQRKWEQMERSGNLSASEAARRDAARQAMDQWEPEWLGWSDPLRAGHEDLTDEQQIARGRPRIMGRYDNGEVFAIRREIGEGQVLMITSGCYPVWNNLATEYSVLILDQILRGMLSKALPQRTLDAPEQVVVPIGSRDQAAELTVQGPGDTEPQALPVEALGESKYGVVVRSLARRGVYEVRRLATGGESADNAWTLALASNGPASESDLGVIDEAALADRLQLKNVRWLDADDEISLEGKTYLGHDVWKYLMLGVIGCLLVEMFLLTPKMMSRITGARTATSTAVPAFTPSGSGRTSA